jgi:hypothetical protein
MYEYICPGQVQVRLQEDLWSAIESFRRNEPDIPSRPEAVRRLLHRALGDPVRNNAAAPEAGSTA